MFNGDVPSAAYPRLLGAKKIALTDAFILYPEKCLNLG